MKARGLFVLCLVLSLSLVPILIASTPVRAQSQYTERIDVYTAGSSAYWLMSMDRLNSSLPTGLVSAESTSGVSSYRLLALSAQSVVSDFQVFGVDGYNVLKVPSTPSQALFLTVNASSASAASPLVTYFATRFATVFTLVSSGSGAYVYEAPVNFAGAAAPVLYRLVPTTMKGFAGFLTEASFSALAMPSIALSGTNNGSGFSHSITIGAAESGILNSTDGISLTKVLSNQNATLTASSSASSSVVEIHALDATIRSTDKTATVSNDASALSGTYTLSAAAGSKVRVNATLNEVAPTALAYRTFDRGSLTTNQTLAVTIYVRDTAESGNVANVTVNDAWWKSYPTVFAYESGNYSFTLPLVAAGQNQTESYTLKVISAASSQVVVSPATVTYHYLLSGASYASEATTNAATLQVNGIGPAVTATVRSTVSSGAPLGTAGNYTITLTNSGTSPALNVKVAGTTIESLAAQSSQVVSLPVTLSGLAASNFTRSFPVQYTNSTGGEQAVSSNSVSLLLSHTSMVIPFVQLSTSDALTASAISSRLLNVTYTYANRGTATAGAVAGGQSFPSGIACKVLSGEAKGSCSGGNFTATIGSLTTQNTQVFVLQLNFTQDNFVIAPSSTAATYEGTTLHTFGGAYAIPAGIELSKSLSIASGFPGMNALATVVMTNAGTSPVYNATLFSSVDPFDSIPGGSATTHSYSILAPQQRESFNYTVTLTNSALGNATSSVATVDLTLGGLTVALSSSPAYVVVFKPVAASVSTTPSSPEENHDFTMVVTFTNAASVPVSGVTYSFVLPSGLAVVSGAQVSGHTATVTMPSLAANSSASASVVLSASTGLTLQTSTSHVAFQYQGFSLNGLGPKNAIDVGVDVTTRYTLPIVIAVVVALAALVYVRTRLAAPAAPAPKA